MFLAGLVAQDTQLFGGTVEENIAYGLDTSEYTQEDLEAAADRANAREFIESKLSYAVYRSSLNPQGCGTGAKSW